MLFVAKAGKKSSYLKLIRKKDEKTCLSVKAQKYKPLQGVKETKQF